MCSINYPDNVINSMICPITMEIMIKSTLAADGRNYEFTAIKEWLNRNLGKDWPSPVTNEKFSSRLLIVNRDMASMIAAYNDLKNSNAGIEFDRESIDFQKEIASRNKNYCPYEPHLSHQGIHPEFLSKYEQDVIKEQMTPRRDLDDVLRYDSNRVANTHLLDAGIIFLPFGYMRGLYFANKYKHRARFEVYPQPNVVTVVTLKNLNIMSTIIATEFIIRLKKKTILDYYGAYYTRSNHKDLQYIRNMDLYDQLNCRQRIALLQYMQILSQMPRREAFEPKWRRCVDAHLMSTWVPKRFLYIDSLTMY